MDVAGKPFQILGIDLMIDESLKAWALEINASPSLNIYFDNHDKGEHYKPTDADICEVDLYVKSRVVKDAILLC